MKGTSVFHVDLITPRKSQNSQEMANPMKDSLMSLVVLQAFLSFRKIFT